MAKNFSDEILHWVEVGHPDDKRLMKASGRARAVSVWAFQNSTPIWWDNLANKVSRAQNLTVWQVPPSKSQALATLAQRSMQLQMTVQDGTVWSTAATPPSRSRHSSSKAERREVHPAVGSQRSGLAQLAAQDLAHRGFGQRVDKHDVLWAAYSREVARAVLAHLLFAQIRAVAHHEQLHGLA